MRGCVVNLVGHGSVFVWVSAYDPLFTLLRGTMHVGLHRPLLAIGNFMKHRHRKTDVSLHINFFLLELYRECD